MRDMTDPSLDFWMMAGWPDHLPTPSSYERVAMCPRSEALPHVLTQESTAARMGTVAHAFLADCISIGRDAALAQAPESDRDWLEALELDRLPLTQGEFWPEVAVAYDIATGKGRVLGHNLTREKAKALKTPTETVGLMDVAATTENSVFVADWKTGFAMVTPAAENWQLRAYALFLARALGKPTATVSIVRVRTDGAPPWYDTAQLTDLDLDVFEQELLAMFDTRSKVQAQTRARQWHLLPKLHEGPWCTYCPAKNACPARIGAMTAALGDKGDPLRLTPEKAGPYWGAVDVVRATANRWEGILEDFARETPFPLGHGGLWVGPVERKAETPIVPEAARDVLVQMFGELGRAVFADAVEISDSVTKASLERALRKLVLPTRPDMKMTHLRNEVLAALRAGGALAVKPQKKVPVGEYRPKVALKEEAEENEAA